MSLSVQSFGLNLGYMEYKVAIGVLLFDYIGEVVNLPVIFSAYCSRKGLLMPKSYNFRMRRKDTIFLFHYVPCIVRVRYTGVLCGICEEGEGIAGSMFQTLLMVTFSKFPFSQKLFLSRHRL